MTDPVEPGTSADVSLPPSASRVPVIGVDIGGVLVDRAFHDTDTSFFGTRPNDTPPVPGCLQGLRELVEIACSNVHIVSKAGPRVAELSMNWLRHHGMLECVEESNVWFVQRRADKAYFAEQLGFTHFIDDRIDVLETLTSTPHRLLFTGAAGQPKAPRVPRWAHPCPTWSHVVRHVRTTVRRGI